EPNERYSLENLKRYANTKVGQIMLEAKLHGIKSFEAFIKGDIEIAIHEQFQAYKLCELVCSTKPVYMEYGNIDILKDFIANNPCNAEAKFVLAFTYFSFGKSHEVVFSLMDECIALSPLESTYYKYRGSMKCFDNRYEEAIEDFDMVIKICGSIQGYGIYYSRAVANRLLADKILLYIISSQKNISNNPERPYYKRSLSDYETFLKFAPPEDRKIPETFYGMALCYTSLKDFKKAKECYDCGLEAEKKRLPVFGPFDFPPKATLEAELGLFSFLENPSVANICPVCKKKAYKICAKCKDNMVQRVRRKGEYVVCKTNSERGVGCVWSDNEVSAKSDPVNSEDKNGTSKTLNDGDSAIDTGSANSFDINNEGSVGLLQANDIAGSSNENPVKGKGFASGMFSVNES
ncbi:15236_t:CDS:2, partial [Acaulospora colombiana]